MNWKELECTGRQCNHETLENHYIVFDRDIKHSQQQLLESLEEEVEEMAGELEPLYNDGNRYTAIVAKHTYKVLGQVKALIQSKKNNL